MLLFSTLHAACAEAFEIQAQMGTNSKNVSTTLTPTTQRLAHATTTAGTATITTACALGIYLKYI